MVAGVQLQSAGSPALHLQPLSDMLCTCEGSANALPGLHVSFTPGGGNLTFGPNHSLHAKAWMAEHVSTICVLNVHKPSSSGCARVEVGKCNVKVTQNSYEFEQDASWADPNNKYWQIWVCVGGFLPANDQFIVYSPLLNLCCIHSWALCHHKWSWAPVGAKKPWTDKEPHRVLHTGWMSWGQ